MSTSPLPSACASDGGDGDGDGDVDGPPEVPMCEEDGFRESLQSREDTSSESPPSRWRQTSDVENGWWRVGEAAVGFCKPEGAREGRAAVARESRWVWTTHRGW